jgi:Cu/Zn superoxide dismutase
VGKIDQRVAGRTSGIDGRIVDDLEPPLKQGGIMEKEQGQLQGAAEQQQPGPRVQPQAQGQPAVDPVMRQMQAMLHQLAADQQAMWQQMQAMHTLHAQGYDQTQYKAPRQQGAPPQAEACEHHTVDPRQQAEHFMRMAEKFSRGDLSMVDVAGGLSYLNTQNSSFWKGLLIGGGLTKRMIDGFPCWI